MTLEGVTTLYQHPNAKTMYVTIPANMAVDSQFPFKAGDTVIVELCASKLIIRRKQTWKRRLRNETS